MPGTLLRAARMSTAPMAGLMAVGVFWGGFSALVPDIKASVGASDKDLGLALIMSALGGMVATLLVPRLGVLFGRLAIPVLGGFLVAAFFYLLLAGSVTTLRIVLFFIGASVALLDITSNVRISVLETRHRLHLMNVNHAMFSFAFGGAAFVSGLARRAGYNLEHILPVLAIIAGILVVFMWENPARYGTVSVGGNATGHRSQLPHGAILMTGLILFAAFIGENSTETWSALHIERTLAREPGEGASGPAMLGLVMGIVRLFGHMAVQRIGETRLIVGSAVFGAIGAIVIGGAPTQGVVLLGVAIVSLGMAIVVPSANSILGRLVSDEQRSYAISRAWMFGMFGFFIGPAMMGLISENFGLRVSFYAVSVIVAMMIPAGLALARRERNHPRLP